MVTTTSTYTLQIREPGNRGQNPCAPGWYPVRKNLDSEDAARSAHAAILMAQPVGAPPRSFRILCTTTTEKVIDL